MVLWKTISNKSEMRRNKNLKIHLLEYTRKIVNDTHLLWMLVGSDCIYCRWEVITIGSSITRIMLAVWCTCGSKGYMVPLDVSFLFY